MPTFVYMTRCDGCGHCVDICPSDIMHIDPTYRRAYNIEPDMCWECFSCVKACPQNAIDVAGMPTLRPWDTASGCAAKKKKAQLPGRIKFRDGTEKNFPLTDHDEPWGEYYSKAEGRPGTHKDMRDSRTFVQ